MYYHVPLQIPTLGKAFFALLANKTLFFLVSCFDVPVKVSFGSESLIIITKRTHELLGSMGKQMRFQVSFQLEAFVAFCTLKTNRSKTRPKVQV